MSKIKLIVADENTLGFIVPNMPRVFHVLHANVLKGSPYSDTGINSVNIPLDGHQYRLATKQDFIDYRVRYEGYFKEPWDYEWDEELGTVISNE